MGTRYERWNRDEAVRPLLASRNLADCDARTGDALEVLVLDTPRVRKEYGLSKKAATEAVSRTTGLKDWHLARYIQDVRSRTTDRTAKI